MRVRTFLPGEPFRTVQHIRPYLRRFLNHFVYLRPMDLHISYTLPLSLYQYWCQYITNDNNSQLNDCKIQQPATKGPPAFTVPPPPALSWPSFRIPPCRIPSQILQYPLKMKT